MHKTPKQFLTSNEPTVYVEFVPESKKKLSDIVKSIKNSKLFHQLHIEEEFYVLYSRVIAFSKEPLSKVKKVFPSARII
jgi:ERCC4-type nuclease